MPLVTVPAVFDGKHIRLLEDAPVREPYRVMVTFVNPEADEPVKPTLDRFWASFGAWEDDRPIEETLRNIYETRKSRTEPPSI